MNDKLILTTSINPELLKQIYNESKYDLLKVVILTVDYKPIELYNSKEHTNDTKSKVPILSNYDVAALIISVVPKKVKTKIEAMEKEKTIFVLAQNVIKLAQDDRQIISLNGFFDIVPSEMIIEVYKNFSSIKSANLEKLEDFLELSKNEPALKAYLKLSSYFSEQNYFINNNLFKLLEHKQKSIDLAKKILLKSIVAWQIRK